MWSIFLSLLLVDSTFVFALDKFGVLEVTKAFAEDVLAAGRGEVPSYDAGIFSADVKGEVDVFGKLDGREVATDFIFSTFSSVAANPVVISPIGRPVSYNVSAASVQHDVAALSAIFDLEYPMLSKTWSIQIDGWFRVNDNREIEAFDLAFRYFPWLMDQVMRELELRLANITDSGGANTTSEERLSSVMLEQICSTAISGCTGSNSQFADMTTCMSTLGDKGFGQFYQLRDDTILCRAVQAPLIASSADRYCSAIGASSPICSAQDYTSSVNDTAPKGWLAAKYVSPENAKYVEHIYAISGQPLDPLLEVGLNEETLHSWDPTLYATATFGYFLLYYASAHLAFFLFRRYSTCFPDLTHEHQKNVVIYAMTILFTTIAFALQLASIRWAFGHYALRELQTIRTAGVMVSSLYIFELLFRFNMRYPLMNWSKPLVAKILKFAAIQTFFIKTASAIGVFAYWAVHQRYTYRAIDYAWSATTVILVVGLMATQVWGSWVTYTIGVRIERKVQPQSRDSEIQCECDADDDATLHGPTPTKNSSSTNSSTELTKQGSPRRSSSSSSNPTPQNMSSPLMVEKADTVSDGRAPQPALDQMSDFDVTSRAPHSEMNREKGYWEPQWDRAYGA